MRLFSKANETGVHFVYWLVFLIGYFIELDPKTQFVFAIADTNPFTWSYLFMNVSTFYLNYLFMLKKFVDIKMPAKFLIGGALIFAYFIFTRYFIEETVFYQLFGTGNYFEGTTLAYYIFDNLYWALTPIITSTIIWLVINYIRTLQNEVLLNEEKKKAEILFLRSQINPHFIFNTLNNIYSMVFLGSKQALPAIEKLSEIMRFTTYETQKDRIPISSEIKYIESFIDLEKIRNPHPIYIDVLYEIENEDQLIPPYLLLVFVENCIKHGVLNDRQNPVVFEVKCSSKRLVVTVRNKINANLKDQHSGIGLSNLEKRLGYYFPGKYKLDIVNGPTNFKSYLEIDL